MAQPADLKELFKSCRTAFKYVLLFSAISNFLMLAVPIYSLQVLDRVVSSGSMDTLVMLTLIVGMALLSLSMLQTARSFIVQRTSEWLDRKLSPAIFTFAVNGALVVKQPIGSQGLRDLMVIKQFMNGPAMTAWLDAPWSVIFVLVLFAIHPLVGMLTLMGGGALLILAMLQEYATRAQTTAAGQQFMKSTGQLEMATRNAEAIEAMGMLGNILKSWEKTHGQALKISAEASDKTVVLGSISRFVRFGLQILVIAVTGWLVLDNSLTAGAIIASSILVSRALAPIEAAISSWSHLGNAREAYGRLQQLLQKGPVREEEIDLPVPKGVVEAENLSFLPPGGIRLTLKGVSFRVLPGELLGVIGPSGAGKSTLAKLIIGVWRPSGGAVRLDGADVFRWNRAQFGRHVGYLPQDVELFSGTVRENIARMDPDADDARVVEAASLAGVHEMILKLPKGYETEIGTGGAILSGGQRQRVGLARAFYGRPRLLVLDEPNASLDSDGEAALLVALKRARMVKITVIIIAHRPSLMQFADKVLLLRNGEVAAFGPRDEVFRKLRASAESTGALPSPQQAASGELPGAGQVGHS